MYAEDDLDLAAVQHLLFCKRQCALIHLEERVENLIEPSADSSRCSANPRFTSFSQQVRGSTVS